jgi:hypothetical protein
MVVGCVAGIWQSIFFFVDVSSVPMMPCDDVSAERRNRQLAVKAYVVVVAGI